ncbi:MAG: UvrD-helicase domain-containing protein [Nitrospiraceae bacterium]|nr:UvrD-helicase domain-containing protein [Nitrospiraceae bacterium]
MAEFYNTKKSFIISSPAGSGKTEKLARRYISLIAAGGEVERVLAITFTEKAASEMKQRILSILARENPELYSKVKPRVPLMRISTIHAFCLKLLRRFSLDLGLDPRLSVADEGVSSALLREAVMDVLRGEAEGLAHALPPDAPAGPIFTLMKARGVRGWDSVLKNHLAELFRQRPLSELILEEPLDLRPVQASEKGKEKEMMLLQLFARCLEVYRAKKLEARVLDFSDLEILAYKALAKSPHWQNILYSFDEYTDHILVDEFQDTSALQWRILDKLTEEWRSGMGPKREAGTVPTFFLVGDEKQSIYLFRGADVSAMKKARQRLQDFLGNEYEFHQAKDNYRSLPEIIEFTNRLFERLMPRTQLPRPSQTGPDRPEPTDEEDTGRDRPVSTEDWPASSEDWQVEYCPFEAKRQGDGKVELLLLDMPQNGSGYADSGRAKDKRDFEARMLAKRIKAMRRNYLVTNQKGGQATDPKGRKRPCEYADMAVLLRQRTHLAAFEEAFRREDVPFLVIKGMGFYEEPEVALLREFATFIADPEDDHSLFCLLRSPLFGLGYKALSNLHSKGKNKKGKLKKQKTLIEGLRASRVKKHIETAAMLDSFIETGKALPLSKLIELMLVKTGGWRHFWEKPRHANVKKFIQLVESHEAQGHNLIDIRDRLLADRSRADVSKANVNAEGMDVVKLMTVHAAKGLQFPMLFLPSLDEDINAKSGPVVIEERSMMEGNSSGVFSFRYEPDSETRKKLPEFERGRIKELEEEKRLFYVAATRAMDYILLSGIRSPKPKGRLRYLADAFGSDFFVLNGPDAPKQALLPGSGCPLPFNVITAEEVESNYARSVGMELVPERHFLDEPLYAEPFEYEPPASTKDVTEDILVKTRHGRDWVLLGRLMHQVLEELSEGRLAQDKIRERAVSLLKGFYIFERRREKLFTETILGDIEKLRAAGILEEVVLPRQGRRSFTELPFVHEKGKTLYKGRIDRLMIEEGVVRVYDYKSFPARPQDIGELAAKYSFQMELYREAAEGIFGLAAKAFLVFTHIPLVIETGGP